MTKDELVDVLLEVGKQAANESDVTHPEDIEIAMTAAMRAAATTINVMTKRQLL